MPNRLANETSPYLLQHANNPVDWHPWGVEALQRARQEDKPILLSIGYAACHWCHVMEHESFEDEATARAMNDAFVSIKVDREERPDLDGIYMQAVQAMTGHGGWPMTVFLTPEGVPFYAGTYFPKHDQHGMPSFTRVLAGVLDAYRNKRGSVDQTVERLREFFATSNAPMRSSGHVTAHTLEGAYRSLAQQFDMRHGGFGGAPKFPATMGMEFLLSYWRRTATTWAREMVEHSFRHMARGGIYDQVGGGFARYSVDAEWLVPHFEKMLYDNALLVRLGVHLWQATLDAEVRRVTEETLTWLQREMTSPAGGFYSSLDADSEGHEGKFYLWSPDELDALLGADAGVAKAFWGVTAAGNFEESNILNVPAPVSVVASRLGIGEDEVEAAIARAKQVLYEARATRVWPGRDEKVLASWNALMLRGVAEAARVFGKAEHRELAIRNGEFLRREMVRATDDGLRVMRSHKDGVTRLTGYLEDHAAVSLAFLDLYALTFDRRWFDDARALGESMLRWFWDNESGGFFDTAADHEQLITRPRDVSDNATPAGTSLAVELLLRLSELGRDEDVRRRADFVLETLAESMSRHPSAFGHLLTAADMYVHGAVEVVVVGDPSADDFRGLAGEVSRHFVPSLVLAGGPVSEAEGIALLEGRVPRADQATAFVCRQYLCEAPTSDASELGAQLDHAVRSPLGVGA